MITSARRHIERGRDTDLRTISVAKEHDVSTLHEFICSLKKTDQTLRSPQGTVTLGRFSHLDPELSKPNCVRVAIGRAFRTVAVLEIPHVRLGINSLSQLTGPDQSMQRSCTVQDALIQVVVTTLSPYAQRAITEERRATFLNSEKDVRQVGELLASEAGLKHEHVPLVTSTLQGCTFMEPGVAIMRAQMRQPMSSLAALLAAKRLPVLIVESESVPVGHFGGLQIFLHEEVVQGNCKEVLKNLVDRIEPIIRLHMEVLSPQRIAEVKRERAVTEVVRSIRNEEVRMRTMPRPSTAAQLPSAKVLSSLDGSFQDLTMPGVSTPVPPHPAGPMPQRIAELQAALTKQGYQF